MTIQKFLQIDPALNNKGMITWTKGNEAALYQNNHRISGWNTSGHMRVEPGTGYKLVEIRSDGHHANVTFQVGVIFAMVGQSNINRWMLTTSPKPSHMPGTWIYDAVHDNFAPLAGSGAIAFANAVTSVLHMPVAMVNLAVNNAGLLPRDDTGRGTWGTGGTLTDDAVSVVSHLGGRVEAILVAEGEASSAAHDTAHAFHDAFADWLTTLSQSMGDAHVFVQGLGRTTNPISEPYYDTMRQVEIQVADELSFADMGAVTTGYRNIGGNHFADYVPIAQQMAHTYLDWLI